MMVGRRSFLFGAPVNFQGRAVKLRWGIPFGVYRCLHNLCPIGDTEKGISVGSWSASFCSKTLEVTLMPSEWSPPSLRIPLHPPVNTPSDPSTPHQMLHLTRSRCATLLASTCLDLRHEVSVSLTYEMGWMRYWLLPEGGSLWFMNIVGVCGGSWWFYHSF